MKRNILAAAAIFLTLLWAQAVLADSLSLAKQWEARGKYLEAAGEYSAAANQSNNLNRKAELLYEVGRCRLKGGEVAHIGALISDIKELAADRGAKLVPKLLVLVENFGWNAGDEQAYQALSIVLNEYPGKRQAFAEKANGKGRKELAYALDSNIKSFDCKAKRAKALTMATIVAAAELDATRSKCQDIPEQTEFKAFSNKALNEMNEMAALALNEQIKAIWGSIDQQNVNRFVAFGEKIARIEGREADVEKIRGILPDAVVEDKLKRVLPHPEGEWTILNSKGGERTPYWVAPSVVGRVDLQSNGCNYAIVLEDNQRFNMRDPDDVKRFESIKWVPKFYVVATPAENQPKNLQNGMCYVVVKIKSF